LCFTCRTYKTSRPWPLCHLPNHMRKKSRSRYTEDHYRLLAQRQRTCPPQERNVLQDVCNRMGKNHSKLELTHLVNQVYKPRRLLRSGMTLNWKCCLTYEKRPTSKFKYNRSPMSQKNWEDILEKLGAAFSGQVNCTWKACRDKVAKMKTMY
jgi:hypothetical protein